MTLKSGDLITQKCKVQFVCFLSPKLLILICLFPIFIGLQTTATADQCPPNFEDCITVTEQRPSCIRDDCREIPPNFSADCFKSLVDYKNPVISGEYLEQRANRLHPGIDIAVPNGTRVNALKKGTVIQLKRGLKKGDRSVPNGNYVRVTNFDGTESVYLHLETVSVEIGQEINAGEKIGTSNDTGWSEGPHVHYQEYKQSSKKSKKTNDPTLVHAKCA